MQLGTFIPPISEGDRLAAQDHVNKPSVVVVKEIRSGIKTKFNSDPKDKNYKADGGDAVILDVADLATGTVSIGVMWMNPTIVDSLRDYVGQTLPIRLVWTQSKSGGNPYLSVEPLAGNDLMVAQGWASANPTRFDTERAARAQANGTTAATQQPPPGYANLPTLAATMATPAPAPAPAPAPVTVAPAVTPEVLALLQQIANQGK